MNPVVRQIVLTFAVIAQLNFDLIIIPVLYACRRFAWLIEPIGWSLFGFLFAQLTIVVAYCFWGADHWIRRTLKSLFVLIATWYFIAVGAVSTENSFEIGSLEMFAAMLVWLPIPAVGIAFCVMRIGSGYLIGIEPNEDQTEGLFAGSKQRSSLFEYLIWAAMIITVVLMLTSQVATKMLHPRGSISYQGVGLFGLFMIAWAVACLIFVIPLTWAVLSRPLWPRRILYVLLSVAAVIGLELIAVNLFERYQFVPKLLLGFHCGVLIQSLCWLVLLRTCGYRLQFGPKFGH